MSERILHTILFSTGASRDVESDEEEIRKLAAIDFDGFSIFRGKGYWQGKAEEASFQVLIATDRAQELDAFIARIKAVFAQEAVVHIRHEAASVTFHDTAGS